MLFACDKLHVQGNTRGLGGPEGALEAIGSPLAQWQTRSIPGSWVTD